MVRHFLFEAKHIWNESSDMKRKSVPNKIRALLQQEIGSICPFCENKSVDHFEVHHIDENPENNNFDNLILLDPLCHSKITKGNITQKEIIEKKLYLRGIERPDIANRVSVSTGFEF